MQYMPKNILNTEKVFSKTKPIDKLTSIKAIEVMICEQIEGIISLRSLVYQLDMIINKIYIKLFNKYEKQVNLCRCWYFW